MTDAEYIHYFLLWAVVAAGIILGLNKLMQSTLETSSNVTRKPSRAADATP